MKTFSQKEALSFGWKIAKINLGFFVGFLIVWAFLYIVPAFIAEIVLEDNILLGVITYIADYILTTIITIGLVKTSLRLCDNEKGKFSDLISQYRFFFRYLFSIILYSLAIIAGFVLFIIPGIIIAIRFWFFDYLIIDKGMGPISALKTSYAMTKGHVRSLFILASSMSLINLLGLLSLIVGLFVTVPTTIIAKAYIYRKLLTQYETKQAS